MAFGFTKTLARPKASPIAVDFGADSLKLLQLVPGEVPQLVAAAAVTIPDHARRSAEARRAYLGDALRKLLKNHAFKGRRAMLSLPAFQTLVQNIQVPQCDPSELTAHVNAHLQDRLGVNPNRMVTRYFLADPQANGGNRQELVCIGASRETVMQYVQIAQAAKLEVVGMHSEPPCLPLAFNHIYNRRTGDAEQVRCFVDIGSATTKVVISEGGKMVFAKTIHAAGDQITRALSEQRKIDFADARAMRIRGDAADPASATNHSSSPAPPMAEPNEPADSGLAVLNAARRGASDISPTPPAPANAAPNCQTETVDCLLDELQLCVRHYLAMGQGKRIDKLIFVGGEAHHKLICQSIARRLRIAAQLGDPFARLIRTGDRNPATGVDIDQPQPGWAVPYGLCLSEANL